MFGMWVEGDRSLLEGLTHDLGTVDEAGARCRRQMSRGVDHLLPSQRDSGRKERYHVESRRMLRQTNNPYHLFTTLYTSHIDTMTLFSPLQNLWRKLNDQVCYFSWVISRWMFGFDE